jgi:spermidine/putrescine ABC transporter ATP-binding subunit
MRAAAAVSVRGVRRAFGLIEAVKGVSFEVAEGEFLVLLGPSGSGKTTILRIIAGFEELSQGEVEIRGRSVADVPANQRDIGVVFQHFALFPHLSVFRNVAFGLEMRRVAAPELRSRVASALEMVRLVGFDDRMPSQLSGGQQQRVALARALVTRPAVLLLDEPLGSLDPHLRGEMQAEIRPLQRELAITAIMVTHDQEEAMTMADRIAVLHEGSLRQLGTPREVYGHPASAFVARFIGAANIFRVEAVRPEGGRLLLTIHDRLSIAARDDGRARPGGTLSAMVRPEQVRLGEAAAGLENAMTARVAAIAYAGAVARCQLVVAGDSHLSATVPADDAALERLAVGDEVRIGWRAAATVLLPGQ